MILLYILDKYATSCLFILLSTFYVLLYNLYTVYKIMLNFSLIKYNNIQHIYKTQQKSTYTYAIAIYIYNPVGFSSFTYIYFYFIKVTCLNTKITYLILLIYLTQLITYFIHCYSLICIPLFKNKIR